MNVTFSLNKVYELEHRSLVSYLESCGVPLIVAKKYLKEVLVNNKSTRRKFHTISLQTEEEGYEIRNKIFKGSIGLKSISFIRGKQIPAVEIHIFKDMMDFLSTVINQEDSQFAGDAIVLNSIIVVFLK